jgi:hypothetical protein
MSLGLWPRLNSAEQNQDQENDDDKAKSAAAVIAGAVERTAAKAAEAAEQNDDKNYYKYGAERHNIISEFYIDFIKGKPRLLAQLFYSPPSV